MNSTSERIKASQNWSLLGRAGVREALVLVLAVLGLYVALALVSYSPADASWNFAGSTAAANNIVGASGAWLSDFALTAFGFVAYAIPGLIWWLAVRVGLNGRGDGVDAVAAPSGWSDRAIVGLRCVGVIVLIASASWLCTLHLQPGALPAGGGGVLGGLLVQALLPISGLIGSTLLAVLGLATGVAIGLALSWLDITERLGRLLWALGGRIIYALRAVKATMWQLLTLARDRFSSWRAQARERALERKQQEDAAPLAAARPDAGSGASAAASPARRTPIISTGDGAAPEPAVPMAKLPPSAPPKLEVIPPAPKPAESQRAQRERQKELFAAPGTEGLPPIALLDDTQDNERSGFSPDSLESMSRLLELKLKDFGVVAEVVAVLPGPVVTRFEIQPAAGVKVSRISALVKDLARSMAVISVRVVEVIPGKSVVGIEIPNEDREIVRLREILATRAFDRADSPLTLALGKNIAGEPVIMDLAKMPHLLIAGTTGSGKSVGVNAMLLSLLFKAGPDQVRLILVDPKMLELAIYEGIPHLLTPVVTDMQEAAAALHWCVGEMERRYQLMAALGVRNLAGYNKKVRAAIDAGEPIQDPLAAKTRAAAEAAGMLDELAAAELPETLTELPFIVVVIDEFADMMMVVGKKVEQLIARIAQKARAAGIHLVLATQRPSVDVITGLIKANIPGRMAFQVSSKIDSRTILDQGGAEQLLGHGDMLFLPPGTSLPERIHGAFVGDDEVHRVVNDWQQRGGPNYLPNVLEVDVSVPAPGMGPEVDDAEQEDALYDEAVEFVLQSRRASISSVQRKLRIGYNRAARLIEAMEIAGLISGPSNSGAREVLVPDRRE